MPNYSGVWDLRQQGVAVKGGLWPVYYDGSDIALFMGGYGTSGNSNIVDYVFISTTGNATDYGNLTAEKYSGSAVASPTVGFYAGGFDLAGAYYNVIEYVTFASGGNTSDWGDLTNSVQTLAGVSSTTRGLWAGGTTDGANTGSVNVIQYLSLASTGNATDFGDLSNVRRRLSSTSNTTRGVWGGGLDGSGGSETTIMEYSTIASAGNVTDFGDLLATEQQMGSGVAASATRGLFIGGDGSNVIQYITIASAGNATDFGDLSTATYIQATTSNASRAVSAGGFAGGNTNVIDYVTIASAGNATDFGDLTAVRYNFTGCGGAQGGLTA